MSLAVSSLNYQDNWFTLNYGVTVLGRLFYLFITSMLNRIAISRPDVFLGMGSYFGDACSPSSLILYGHSLK